jgi:hypothetical protein
VARVDASTLPPFGELVPIDVVERETSLSKDVLRAWERRYGFPTPQRDARGRRAYPREQVQRLLQIKRLVEHGFRPGKLITRRNSSNLSAEIEEQGSGD